MTDDHTHRGDDVHSVEAAEAEGSDVVWHAISSAPRDGSKIKVVSVQDGVWHESSVAWWDVDLCWWSNGIYYDSWPVTHWMPLPAAPTEGE
tara:strand:+ start:243 stop:515 length:273 start_codon:yes stop_codon:yes gene_type:complete